MRFMIYAGISNLYWLHLSAHPPWNFDLYFVQISFQSDVMQFEFRILFLCSWENTMISI